MPVPRYCCMRLVDKAEGFGFSLVAMKNQTGQYIDEVREGSLADLAGLKNGDFVVEVNGENILSCSHPEVVELIKKKGDEVCLLVLDSTARRHYDERSIIVNSSMPEVQRICTWTENSSSKTSSTEESQESSNGVEDKTASEPTPVVAAQPVDVEKPKKAGEITQSPPAPALTAGQSRLPNSSRTTPSRRACMESGTTFGARAKVFDSL
ncbi:Na H exchange regulatory cofactor NHE-RF3 [Taenia crassiceps]|uniref:Na H exchange regulatory cofactor NHE-RF3 n=1 Tax=Taenia crassiceps TaxID=6207 RepID=A0ABR4QQX6_9CEST